VGRAASSIGLPALIYYFGAAEPMGTASFAGGALAIVREVLLMHHQKQVRPLDSLAPYVPSSIEQYDTPGL
jgi:hypothetical protein